MPKITLVLLVTFLFFNKEVSSQKIESVLNAPEEWGKEIIPFPLGFAPEIDLEGFEDIRFAPGWSEKNREDFWTYHFTWFIKDRGPLDEEFLAQTFNLYYDGLSKAVLKEQKDAPKFETLDKSISLFLKTKEGFIGKIRTFDAFVTKEYFELYVRVVEKKCDTNDKQIISFNLSPKYFDHDIWKSFKQINFTGQCE